MSERIPRWKQMIRKACPDFYSHSAEEQQIILRTINPMLTDSNYCLICKRVVEISDGDCIYCKGNAREAGISTPLEKELERRTFSHLLQDPTIDRLTYDTLSKCLENYPTDRPLGRNNADEAEKAAREARRKAYLGIKEEKTIEKNEEERNAKEQRKLKDWILTKFSGCSWYKELCYKRIHTLHGYYESGSISKEEFETLKSDILKNIKK